MSKTWVTKRWVLAAAAASGLLGLVLKVSEISRPGKSTGSAPMHAARSSERHAASGQTAGTVPATPDTPPANTDVAFDSGETASYPTDSQVEVPDVKKIAGQAGTMSFWLQPGWEDGNHDDATFMQLGDSRLQVIKNVNFLRFEFVDDNGVAGGIGAPIAEWKAGEWHQVATTWNGNQFAMYIDGQLVSQTVHDGRVDLAPGTRLFIGSDFPLSRPVAPGTIWGVDVSQQPWSARKVASQFQSVMGGQNPPGTPGRAPATR